MLYDGYMWSTKQRMTSLSPASFSLYHKTNHTEMIRFVRHHLLALSSPNRWGCLRCLSHGAHHEVYESPLLLIHQTWQKNRQVQKWVGDPWVYMVDLKQIHTTSRSNLKGFYLPEMFRVRGSSAEFWHKIPVMALRVVGSFCFNTARYYLIKHQSYWALGCVCRFYCVLQHRTVAAMEQHGSNYFCELVLSWALCTVAPKTACGVFCVTLFLTRVLQQECCHSLPVSQLRSCHTPQTIHQVSSMLMKLSKEFTLV